MSGIRAIYLGVQVKTKLLNFIKMCRKSNSNVLTVILRHMYFRLNKKNIFTTSRVMIKGLHNISIAKRLSIGMGEIGFSHKFDYTYLNIQGNLFLTGGCRIGRGCRIDIGKNAIAELGNCSINVQTKLIITNGLKIGDNSRISWGGSNYG